MNLYFRLFFIIIRLYIKSKPVHLLDVVHTKLRVFPNDLDFNMHINNGRYLTLMDLGRLDLMAINGLWMVARKYKWMPIAGGVNIKFLRPLKLWQKFTLSTQVISWDEKWFYIGQKFEYQGKVMAIAVVKALLRGKTGSIPTCEILSMVNHSNIAMPNVADEFKSLMNCNGI